MHVSHAIPNRIVQSLTLPPTGQKSSIDNTVNELSSLLPGFLRQLHFSEELTGELVTELWKNVVGETLAQNARPLRMQGSTLVLTVSSEAWKKELFSSRFEILKRLEKLLGGPKVSTLELRVDPWTNLAAPQPSLPNTSPRNQPICHSMRFQTRNSNVALLPRLRVILAGRKESSRVVIAPQ